MWLFGLTAVTLVFASLLLLGLLARSAVSDALLRDAVNIYGVLTATIGAIALAYVLITASRAGYLRRSGGAAEASSSATPAGLHLAPSIPAGYGLRRHDDPTWMSGFPNDRPDRIAQVSRSAPPTRAPVTGPVGSPGPTPPAPIDAIGPGSAPGGVPHAFLRMPAPPAPVRSAQSALQVTAAGLRPPGRATAQPPTILRTPSPVLPPRAGDPSLWPGPVGPPVGPPQGPVWHR